MEQWSDGRVITATDLEALLLFLFYVPKTLSQIGYRFGGFVARQKNGQTLLTVKVREGDIPLVAFLTSNNTTGCMCRFLDLMEQDRINWVRDRYPWI